MEEALVELVKGLKHLGPEWMIGGVSALCFVWKLPEFLSVMLTHLRLSKKDKAEQTRMDKRLREAIGKQRNRIQRRSARKQ